jgi:hypothetical protein
MTKNLPQPAEDNSITDNSITSNGDCTLVGEQASRHWLERERHR